ncbi:hypothetical protein BP6252_10927 [Coleophoma cylindrospora]|uniref:NACHT domain-containing protein n=1 Tax=Coleophoma cylindrospora TaxID=1849047 RepID=A0A3D8QNK8_9HELO|nr:hypothetical protein BP6252_10927 [Coleophoma cylindrospora]
MQVDLEQQFPGPRVSLRQVFPNAGTDTDTDTNIDIIAIHGLDTNSPDTWIWADRSDPTIKYNWLQHPDMLPAKVKRVRIFTCDWPAELLQKSVPTTLEESARILLDSTKRHLAVRRQTTSRPILFIASCLGGIILIKALEMDDSGGHDESHSPSLRKATRGIIFLATPFRGTAFKDMPNWMLTVWASLQDRTVTALIEYTKKPTPVLGELLVDESSASLQGFASQRLNRRHVLMNKFTPECEDFEFVSNKIEDIRKEICAGTSLEQADAHIRDKYYSEERLKIEQLSGDRLSMDHCYINLAIIEQPDRAAGRSEGSESKITVPHSSPFSLSSRLKIETPDQEMQVELQTLFDPRPGPNRDLMYPRRILIRGRAGIGKTTLCKKMVHAFYRKNHKNAAIWNKLFDRILWIPLRTLKAKHHDNFESFFLGTFFVDTPNRKHFAKELEKASGRTLFILDGLDEVSEGLNSDHEMNTFLASLLGQPNVIVTSRPSVRLSGKFHPDLELETIGFYPDQLESYVEKAFAHPDVGDSNSRKVNEILSYLERHQLMQSLVRIPIQLDALCYTWSEWSHSKPVPETMTQLYNAIELKLWKKDFVRSRERIGKSIQNARDRSEIEVWVKTEMLLVEFFAFSGLYNDVINFEFSERDLIYAHFQKFHGVVSSEGKTIDDILAALSFLRTSDASSENRKTTYHFLHLTFQEYFAARYFVRQWTSDKQDLNCLQFSIGKTECLKAGGFLQNEKYNTRYDIFWRFVAGLLQVKSDDSQLCHFFNTIDEEPRDLFGPAHQRLVMHCLSEVQSQETADFKRLREQLNDQLKQWLVFECKLVDKEYGIAKLSAEMEFPEPILEDLLSREPERTKFIILRSIAKRPRLSPTIIEAAVSCLGNNSSDDLKTAVLKLFQQGCTRLVMLAMAKDLAKNTQSDKAQPLNILGAVVALLKDPDNKVRNSASKALERQSNLPAKIVNAVGALLKDPDNNVRISASRALSGQSNLPAEVVNASNLSAEVVNAAVALLKDPDSNVRYSALEILQRQSNLPAEVVNASNLPAEVVNAVVALLKDPDYHVRDSALRVLGRQSNLPAEVLNTVVTLLEDPEPHIRNYTMTILGNQLSIVSDEDFHSFLLALDAESFNGLYVFKGEARMFL